MTNEELLTELCITYLRRAGYTVRKGQDIGGDMVEKIKHRVADVFGVRIADLIGQGRTTTMAQARQLAMYLARTNTKLSSIEVGIQFGGRDHGTVLHACGAVKRRMATDAAFAKLVLDIHNGLR